MSKSNVTGSVNLDCTTTIDRDMFRAEGGIRSRDRSQVLAFP